MAVLPVGIGSEVGAGGYQIERSLRFNSADSAYLNRTPASAGNRQKWTISLWTKRSDLTNRNQIINFGDSYGSGGSADGAIYFNTASQAVELSFVMGGGTTAFITTTAVYRDPSSWYHIVIAVDTTQATASNRVKMYVNGVQITSFSSSTYPSQNLNTNYNNTNAHRIGVANDGGLGGYYNGYMTEIYSIDGQQLSPTDFGEFNTDTGVWQPIEYTGTYGTNGFYLNFSDNSGTTSTTLGADSSGNGNNWTPNNFSVTAGAGNDSLVDSPTRYGTDTGAGGEVRGNYCTMNPLANSGIGTLSNGNLTLVTSTDTKTITGTMALPSSGQWYFEVTATDYVTDGGTFFGVVNNSFVTGAPSNGTWLGFNTYSGTYNNGTSTDTNGLTGTNVTQDGDIWCIAVDVTNGKFWIGRSRSGSLTWADGTTPAVNGSGATTLAFPSGTLYPMAYRGGSFNETYDFNFGQRAFAHTAPSGFKALVTTNLPTPTIEDGREYFNTVLYSGTGSGNSNVVSGLEFTTDLWWQKARNAANNNYLQDAVRGFGASKSLTSNSTGTEGFNGTPLTQSLSVSSTGFTVSGSDFNGNTASETYVAWCWKANGAGSTNTAGTITSTVSVSTTSGFSIVSYTGTGSAATVGHGIGIAPTFVITKPRSATGAWACLVQAANGGSGQLGRLLLDETAAFGANNEYWNDTSPTSTVFSVRDHPLTNGSGTTYVAYCFAPVAGYSAFGSYTGNGSADGPFVFTGFRPRFVMVKRSSTAGQPWQINDTARNPANLANLALHPNASDSEYTYGSAVMDILSNGFKLRGSDAYVNASGSTYIYMAFAENPFAYSLAR